MGLELLGAVATVRICPVCLKQISEVDGDDSCWHFGTAVEPIVVDAYPLLEQLRSRCALALFRLQTDIRDHEFAEAEQRWYDNLSVADRFWEDSRRKRVAREEAEARRAATAAAFAGTPSSIVVWDRAMRDVWQADHMLNSMRMSLIGEWKPRDLDEWLASDDHLAEVDAALGLDRG